MSQKRSTSSSINNGNRRERTCPEAYAMQRSINDIFFFLLAINLSSNHFQSVFLCAPQAAIKFISAIVQPDMGKNSLQQEEEEEKKKETWWEFSVDSYKNHGAFSWLWRRLLPKIRLYLQQLKERQQHDNFLDNPHITLTTNCPRLHTEVFQSAEYNPKNNNNMEIIMAITIRMTRDNQKC